jgi:hypothetical protein
MAVESLNKKATNFNSSFSSSKQQQQPIFIPYRDSKLTRILKQSLGLLLFYFLYIFFFSFTY